ncbi:ROK family protein [Clostridium sp. DJ247]|uniref:ROK family protein n=1 Tax=Clostridium sp. DJ247 TaxID=2726188 RepID=UPI00162A3699|nr:ROK family protein [Clostridium sp. DJ247]MBC2582539.1 ROK family protein [Clostridium sp. DJ247]
MTKKYVIGIDLGGTKINGVVTDLNGVVLSQYTISTNADQGEEVVLDRIIQVIDNVIETSGKSISEIKSIGIGSPGPLDAKHGVIITTPNLPFKNFELVKPIQDKYGLPTHLDNDANVAAIGEFMFGAGKGTENMVYITVSTGIGGGAIINGKIYRGNTSNALEIGHNTILPDGPRCNCGNYGCAEALSSGTAIGREATKAVESGADTTLKNYDKVTSYEVFKEAEKGDKVSKEILNKSLDFLGICVANIIVTFDPEMVVIGGGVSKGGQIVFDKVQEVVNERCFKAMTETCRILPAKLSTDAGVIGAAALAIMES